MKKNCEKCNNQIYGVVRIITGLLFFQHAAFKLFGMFGGSVNSVFSGMGFFGLVELLVSLGLVLGLFVRPSAAVGILLMVIAYFKVHWAQGLAPFVNGGEAAVLFVLLFLLIWTKGAGLWSLEKKIFKKELC